jgi:hypothetical protein
MALTNIVFSLLAFPQRIEAGVLSARVLLLPAFDPRQSVAGLPAFSGTEWSLRASILPGLEALIGSGGAAAQTHSFVATPPAGSVALFDTLDAQFRPVPPRAQSLRAASLGGMRVRKFLPESYTQAFAFDRPGADTTDGNEFGCALRNTAGGLENDPKPPTSLTWGGILSFALRQPVLARALGLIHDFSITLEPPELLESGGWLFVELDPAAGVVPAPGAVRSYAARLPVLAANASRALFGAVLIPTGLPSAGDYGNALLEAATYDDGFAKIVHAAQATTADATSSAHNELPPGTDAGLDIGWDDEQVATWLNRQLDCLRTRLGAPSTPGAKNVEAPLGIGGYRIDVRRTDPPLAGDGWESLCRAFSVNAAGTPAPLRFPSAPAPAAFRESFDGELSIEPVPVRSIHATDEAAWLPQHFARWQGGSLVVNDTTLFELSGTSPQDALDNPMAVLPSVYGAPVPRVRLRYGHEYELRCRLVDLTGGGPDIDHDDAPINPALQPSAIARFRRNVPPKSFRVESNVAPAEPGEPTPPVSKLTALDIRRPLIGYPEMMFAGIDNPIVIAALIARAADARVESNAIGVCDPDVTHVRVSLQVRAPGNDPGPIGLRDGPFREVYSTEIELPPLDPEEVLAPGAPLTLTLDYVDVPDVAQMVPPTAGSAVLPIPTARDVRLRLTPVCADKPNYFGSASVRVGLTSDIATRADAESENDLTAALRPGQTPLAAVFLQPGTGLLQRFAERLHLAANGLQLTARTGERVVFAASGALRHSLSLERDSISFASEGELLGHWIAVIQLELARDWTWNGLEDYGFEVSRSDSATGVPRVVGSVSLPFAVSNVATIGADNPGEDRRAHTRLIFLDAVDPNPPPNTFPRKPTPQWRIEPHLRGFSAAENAALARIDAIDLPISVPPKQVPGLLSAGIALSPYEADETYSSTKARTKALWFELDAPLADPNDSLYARVLAYGPDPLLSGDITHRLIPASDFPVGPTTWFDFVEKTLPAPPPAPALAIDPEPMRVIVPLQPEDTSGLNAMVEMAEAFPQPGETRSRFFRVPLPPGLDPEAPELFGFWTYEIRVGHKRLWSTAQARFGRPLVVQGVQHPAPTLRCTAVRVRPDKRNNNPDFSPRIVVSAPHATAVFAGRALTKPSAGDPRTRLWILLYAQVMQADGASHRNVLLARAPALPRLAPVGLFAFEQDTALTGTRDVMGIAAFIEASIEKRLRDLALPVDSPLSVIAVELLPGDHLLQKTQPILDHEVFFTVDIPDDVSNAFKGANLQSDPLGAELGSMNSRRILRCSPLTPIAPSC